MKKLLAILLFVPLLASAQDDEKKSGIRFGAGFSVGIFNPTDVNDYINSSLDYNNVTVEAGFSEIIMNVGGRLFLGYKSASNFGAELFLEGAMGPKTIMVSNGDDVTFLLNRGSTGLKFTYDWQFSRRHSLIFGAGPMYSNMSFSGGADGDMDNIAKASALGAKLGVAYQFQYKHMAPRAFVDIDIASATDRGLEMNYSGVQIGVAFAGLW